MQRREECEGLALHGCVIYENRSGGDIYGGDLHARAVKNHDRLVIEYGGAGNWDLPLGVENVLKLDRYAKIVLQKMKGVDLPGSFEQLRPVVRKERFCVILYIQILDDRRAVFMVASAAEIDHGVCSWLIWHADICVVFL